MKAKTHRDSVRVGRMVEGRTVETLFLSTIEILSGSIVSFQMSLVKNVFGRCQSVNGRRALKYIASWDRAVIDLDFLLQSGHEG